MTNKFCLPFAENIKEHKKKRCIVALLVIALILTSIGVGLWSASAVLLYSKCSAHATFCLTCMTAKMGKMKIAGNVKDSSFIYNCLLLSNEIGIWEATGSSLRRGNFQTFPWGGHAPWPPYIMKSMPSGSLIPYGNLPGQAFFFGSHSPGISSEHIFEAHAKPVVDL